MNIRSMLVATAAFAMIAGAANAATAINLTAANDQTANIRQGTTEQLAGALDINVGEVELSNVDFSATNLLNADVASFDIDQESWGANLSGINSQTLNLSLGPVTQVALVGVGSGMVDRSNISGAAMNAVNLKSVDIKVKQK